jgi:hypothetical protein
MEVLSEKEFEVKMKQHYGGIYSQLVQKNNLDFIGQTFEEFYYNRVELQGLEFAHEDWNLVEN